MASPPKIYFWCPDCRGSGKKSPDAPCARCKGTRRVEMWTTGRRRFQRYPASLPVAFTIREHRITGKCNQIAEGGLGAYLRRVIPVGSVVSLQFAVPAPGTELRVQGVVRYKAGRQYGVEFLSLSEAERLAIRQFCSNLPTIGEEA